MKSKFLMYALIVALGSSVMSWAGMAAQAGSGRGTGNSWHNYFTGPGYSGGGWATSSGGGHK
ncbi:MAG: hypothetical protein ABSF50_00180 [Burkholderiaceae bacterium]